jgi:hypothetical protein
VIVGMLFGKIARLVVGDFLFLLLVLGWCGGRKFSDLVLFWMGVWCGIRY